MRRFKYDHWDVGVRTCNRLMAWRSINALMCVGLSVLAAGCSTSSSSVPTIAVGGIGPGSSSRQIVEGIAGPLSTSTWLSSWKFKVRDSEELPLDLVGRLLVGAGRDEASQSSAASQSGVVTAASSLYAIVPSAGGNAQGGASIELIQFDSNSNALSFSRAVQGKNNGNPVPGIPDSQALTTSAGTGTNCGSDCFGESVQFPEKNHVVIVSTSCAFRSCSQLATDVAQSLNRSLKGT